MMGVDMEHAGVDARKMRERLRESAEQEIRGHLLLEALADRESIQVADADLDAKIQEMAAVRDKAPQKLKAEMDRDGTLETLRRNLRQEKALDLVVARARITDAPPSPAGDPTQRSEER